MDKKGTVKQEQPIRFPKSAWLASKKYENRKDAINAVLPDDETKQYSADEVAEMLDKFMKGKVK